MDVDSDTCTVDFENRDFAEFADVPVGALRSATRKTVVKYLNVPKDIATDDGYLPDYSGLSEKIGFEMVDLQNFRQKENPTEALLLEWQTCPEATVERLCTILKELHRFDILDEIWKWLERDVKVWRQSRKEWNAAKEPIQDGTVSQSKAELDHSVDQYRYIVTGDVSDPDPVHFDAFICYSGDDISFVKDAIRHLENPPYNISLCIADRDLLPGGANHTLTAKLIEDRCRRMLVVLSQNYLKSPQCDFQTKFAHALAPGSRSKKVIPVLIESCDIPSILRFLTLCDYTKPELSDWFWDRLAKAIQAPLDPRSVEWTDHSLSSIVMDLSPEKVNWDRVSASIDTTSTSSSRSSSPSSLPRAPTKHRSNDSSSESCQISSYPSSSSLDSATPLSPKQNTSLSASSTPPGSPKVSRQSVTTKIRHIFQSSKHSSSKC